MGLFDSVWAALSCPICGSFKEREIQTKQGPCLMLHLEVGDTIEPFFYGDYWIEEEWHCENCQGRMPEESRWQHPHKVFIRCINGLIVEVTPEKPSERSLPDWDLIHTLSRDRLRFRRTLKGIRNSIFGFRRRMEAGEKTRWSPFLDIGPKTVEELLDNILDDIERAEKGETLGLF